MRANDSTEGDPLADVPSVRLDEPVGTGWEPQWRRCRPVWLVTALSFLSMGVVYPVIWLGLTWGELRRELRDDSKRPFWHAMTQFVPIYGYFRFHAHMVEIERLGPATLMGGFTSPTALLWFWIGSLALGRGGQRLEESAPEAALVIFLISNALAAFAIGAAQAAMNRHWRAKYGSSVPENAHWGEWVGLAVGALVTLGIMVGSLQPSV
jgi:hypothetical protein